MKCDICHKDINGKYYIDQWGHNICAAHMDNGEAAMCSSCGSFTTNKALQDGRVFCKNCEDSIVSCSSDVEKARSYVLSQLASVGFDFGNCKANQIPIEVVSAQRIAELRHQPISTNNKGVTFTNVQKRGYSEETMVVVSRTHIIYMLSHQPVLEFMGTLAHEYLHVWLSEHDIELPTMKTEGFCNMGSFLVYERINTPIAQHHIKNLKESSDSIYGDGFRYVFGRYKQSGWRSIMQIANNKTL